MALSRADLARTTRRTALLLLSPLFTGWAASQMTSSSLEEQFKAAVSAYDAGRFPEAASRLEQLEPLAPESFELHELLGLTYGALSRTPQAIAQMQRAVQLRPGSSPAHANLATAFVRGGKPEKAEAEYKAALSLGAGNELASHDLAELLLSENRVADALPLLEAAHRRHPDAPDTSYNLALAYLTTQHADQARTLVTALAQQHDSGELHSLLGRIDEQQENYLDAAKEFAAAAHMDPSEENLFAWASELLLHRAYEPAITVFEQATERYPKSARVWVGLGMASYSHGQYEPAIRALLTAADLNPHDPRCYLFLSKAYYSSPSQADEVIERFRRYHELEPNNALAAYYAAISLWKGRRVETGEVDYKAVESLLRRSIALDGNNPEVHLQLGILYTDERAFDQALPEYQRALQLDPNLADAHFRLGRYYLHAGEKDRAQSEFDVFKKLQAQHQSEVDKERAEVQGFVVSPAAGAPAQP